MPPQTVFFQFYHENNTVWGETVSCRSANQTARSRSFGGGPRLDQVLVHVCAVWLDFNLKSQIADMSDCNNVVTTGVVLYVRNFVLMRVKTIPTNASFE